MHSGASYTHFRPGSVRRVHIGNIPLPRPRPVTVPPVPAPVQARTNTIPVTRTYVPPSRNYLGALVGCFFLYVILNLLIQGMQYPNFQGITVLPYLAIPVIYGIVFGPWFGFLCGFGVALLSGYLGGFGIAWASAVMEGVIALLAGAFTSRVPDLRFANLFQVGLYLVLAVLLGSVVYGGLMLVMGQPFADLQGFFPQLLLILEANYLVFTWLYLLLFSGWANRNRGYR